MKTRQSLFDVDSLVNRLGSLAALWLTDSVLEEWCQTSGAVHETTTESAELFSTTPGSTVILLARTKTQKTVALRDAFVLPVRWCRSDLDVESKSKTSPAPIELRRIADLVKLTLTDPAKPSPAQEFELRIDRADVRLTGLSLAFGSAFVPLAAALLMATEGTPNATHIMSTGAWDSGRGLLPVDGVAAKTSEAARLGAQQFHVPSPNVEEAVFAMTSSLSAMEVCPLLRDGSTPHDARSIRGAIAALLSALDVSPSRSDSLRARMGWFNRSRSRRGHRHDSYYAEHIAEDLAAELRSGWEEEHKRAFPIQPGKATLVMNSTGATPILIRTIEVFRPKRVITLWIPSTQGEQFANAFRHLLQHLSWKQAKVELRRVDVESAEGYRLALSDLLDNDDGLVCDLSGGLADSKLRLSHWAHARGVQRWVCCVGNYGQTNQAQVGDDILILMDD
ncbi:MAG: hypothetical protein O2800_07935 [Planctomycetota bacterium]|nr:hypothetical protein [Planctomycetota bacterium]